MFAPDGIVASAIAGNNADLTIIDTSTIDRDEAVRIHHMLADKGITYADCPISGLPFRAEDGTLTLMFGERQRYLECTPTAGDNGCLYCPLR